MRCHDAPFCGLPERRAPHARTFARASAPDERAPDCRSTNAELALLTRVSLLTRCRGRLRRHAIR
eukprot:10782857-Alexandrium_andersonii.AAC.1